MPLNQTDLIPWVLTPTNPNVATCPSTPHVLDTFAAVNMVTSLIKLLVPNAFFIRFTTCQRLGKDKSESWPYMRLPTLAFQLGENAIVGYTYTLHAAFPDFHAPFSVGDWILLLCAKAGLYVAFHTQGAVFDYKASYWHALMSTITAELCRICDS